MLATFSESWPRAFSLKFSEYSHPLAES